MDLLLDSEQRFTCRSCASCCRRGYDIAVTEAERSLYEQRNAAQWFREDASSAPGARTPPFEQMAAGLYRIRKRRDGVCGFLSPDNRCRIHEELGGAAKPLTCQMFPFSFNLVAGQIHVTTSFCCPTAIRNEGRGLDEQEGAVYALASRWRHAATPMDRPLEWSRGQTLDPEVLESMRWIFRRLLDRHDPTFSLRRNVRRIAVLLEDWTRPRVLKLDSERFAEYVKLTGEFAVGNPADPPRVRPVVARLLFRGFFFASVTPWAIRGVRVSFLGLRLRLLRLLLHVHGVWPSFGDLRFGRALERSLDVDGDPFLVPTHHVLRAAIENLGSGFRPVVEELGLAVGHLLVAEHLYLAREGTGDPLAAWVQALMDAHDVAHADPASSFGRILVLLNAPPNALHLFGARDGRGATSSV